MVAVKLTDSPVHLIGTSMGGGIAGVYASRYPDNVTLLTLICPTGTAIRDVSITVTSSTSTSTNTSTLLTSTSTEYYISDSYRPGL